MFAAAALGGGGGGGARIGAHSPVGIDPGPGGGGGGGVGGIGGGVGGGGSIGGIGGGAGAGGDTGHPVPAPGTTGQPVSLGLTKAAGVVQGLPSTHEAVIQVGDLEAEGAWFYRVDGQEWVPGQGRTIEASAISGQGQHRVEVYQVDLAGNLSGVAALDFWLDSVPPSAPTLHLKNNTGEAGDTLTSDATLIVSGLQPGDEWFFSVDGGALQAGQGEELSDAQIGGDGAHTIRVVVRDATGNQSPESSFTLERDTTAPVTAPVIALQQDTGARGDRLTARPWLSFGGLEPGARWSISLDEGQTWTDPAPSATPQFQDDAAFDRDGHWTVLARQIDAAGNVGTAISTFEFDLDRRPPDVPSVRLKNDSGLSATDRVTNDGTILVQPGEAGLIHGYRQHGDVAWTNLPDGELDTEGWEDGRYDLEFIAWDAAGNFSELARLDFVLDTQAPRSPSLNLGAALLLDLAQGAGVSLGTGLGLGLELMTATLPTGV